MVEVAIDAGKINVPEYDKIVIKAIQQEYYGNIDD